MNIKNVILILVVVVIIVGIAFGINYLKRKELMFGGLVAQSELATDDFSVNLPKGWQRAEAGIGISAMAVNIEENVTDPAAQKINFKTYLAVVYDTLQNRTLGDYLQSAKNGLRQAVPSVVFAKEEELSVNGRPTFTLEAELTQQGVNFYVLMAMIKGEGDDVWVMSFNTVKDSWQEYKKEFYNTINSFTLKKQAEN